MSLAFHVVMISLGLAMMFVHYWKDEKLTWDFYLLALCVLFWSSRLGTDVGVMYAGY